MSPQPLLPLPSDWEPTRATLHIYAHAVGAVARVHAAPHPKWWHISLRATPIGLVTLPMTIPGGGEFWIRMDLSHHAVFVESSDGTRSEIALNKPMTGTGFGDELLGLVGDLGLSGDYDRSRFQSEEPRSYDENKAAAYFGALTNIRSNLEMYRSELGTDVGPLQVWPHGFDLAFEWFGVGESQINLGFYPAGRAYFYSNPFPFDASLARSPLTAPASWHTDGWEGSILYYDDLLQADDPAATLLTYAREVHNRAAPGLRNG